MMILAYTNQRVAQINEYFFNHLSAGMEKSSCIYESVASMAVSWFLYWREGYVL